MRWLALVMCLGGCYKPNFGSPSFYCHEGDTPACPEGQKCVAGRCYDQNASVSGEPSPDDAGVSGDLATGGWGGDLASLPPEDLSSQPPPDLLMCVPLGGYCPHMDSVCCSKWCQYSGPNKDTCVPHP